LNQGRTWLDPVAKALDGAVAPIDLFIRDDDVGWDDGRLWRLLNLLATHGLPVDLALIPTELNRTLASRLIAWSSSAPHAVSLHQHGFAHVNHEPTGRKIEFGPSREGWQLRRDIAEGRDRLRDMLGPAVDPIFTPPWNRCTQATGHHLVELGFEALSREMRAPSLGIPGLVELPVHVDWFAHRKGTRLSRIEFGDLLARVIDRCGRVGLMLHHGAMDESERVAVGELFTLLSEHRSVRPRRMLALARERAETSSLACEVEH
jgi:peptidoglycan/xylan/chitin deacetylase (PgdA/CDA1 family)